MVYEKLSVKCAECLKAKALKNGDKKRAAEYQELIDKLLATKGHF